MRQRWNPPLRSAFVVAAVLPLLAACADPPAGEPPEVRSTGQRLAAQPSDELPRVQPTGEGPVAAAAGPHASSQMRDRTGLSHLPAPADMPALGASLRRHYPARLRGTGRSGAVLVEVSVDEQGAVRGVKVVRPATGADSHSPPSATLYERHPLKGEKAARAMEFDHDDAFGPAALAALRETRFTPAVREADGRPVAYRFRMTLVFDAPRGTS